MEMRHAPDGSRPHASAVPWLYAAALLLPVLSLLGFAASGLEIRRQILEEDAATTIFAQVNAADPAARELIASLDTRNVNIAARLESETKTHGCTLVVSTALAGAAGVDLSSHPIHEAELRGRGGCVQVHAIDDPRELPDPGIA